PTTRGWCAWPGASSSTPMPAPCASSPATSSSSNRAPATPPPSGRPASPAPKPRPDLPGTNGADGQGPPESGRIYHGEWSRPVGQAVAARLPEVPGMVPARASLLRTSVRRVGVVALVAALLIVGTVTAVVAPAPGRAGADTALSGPGAPAQGVLFGAHTKTGSSEAAQQSGVEALEAKLGRKLAIDHY